MSESYIYTYRPLDKSTARQVCCILCPYFGFICSPQKFNFNTYWGPVTLLGEAALPGVLVILTLIILCPANPELSLKPLSHVISVMISLPSYALSTGSESLNASLTYKVLTTTQPPYLHNRISVQCSHSTRSSSVITHARPPTLSSLKITDSSFCYASLR